MPVQVDIINNGSTRTINTFTNPTRNFSVTFIPTSTEYGMYSVGARHPSSMQSSFQMEFGILGMKSIPQVITLRNKSV